MTAPTVADVQTYTEGRLQSSDARTALLLSAALAAARRYCGWHVTPEQSDTFVVDGTGTTLLLLPTMKLVGLISVTENGHPVATTAVKWSARGVISRNTRWCNVLGGIEVVATHGYDTANDFNLAVLSAVDRSAFGATREVIGPFQYSVAQGVNSAFSPEEKASLDLYRLEPVS